MKPFALVAVALIAALALAACGSSSKSTSSSNSAPSTTATTPSSSSSSSSSSSASGNTVALSADASGALKFDKSQATAKAGNVVLRMSNPASIPHGIAIQGPGVATKTGQVVDQGGTSDVSVTLKPGTYTYFCPVPGHRQAGMQGTLTVK